MKFYTNVFSSKNNILFRGVDDDGARVKRRVSYSPSLFFPDPEEPDWKDIKGNPVKRRRFSSIGDYKSFLKMHRGVEDATYCGDIQPEYQYINEEFSDDPDWSTDEIRILNFDIETASENGFPDPEQADQPIICITLEYKGRYLVLGLSEMGKFDTSDPNVVYCACKTESMLLEKLLDFWKVTQPDVITGWNIRFFDIPYLVNRVGQVLGENRIRDFSPWGMVHTRKRFTSFGEEKTVYDFVGISNLDYIDLYRNFTYQARESYKLDYIAHVELGKNKVSHSEHETYRMFYRNDWQKFIEYNIQDTRLVSELDEKMGFIALTLTMAYDCRCNFEDIFMQVRMWDCLSYSYLLNKHVAVPRKSSHQKFAPYSGAFVKDPIRGFHDWVVSFDLNSLYPSLIRQYSIGPDTFVEEKDVPDDLKHLVGLNHVDALLKKEIDLTVLKKHGLCMTANGQFFRNDRKGFLSELMEKLYQERSDYKKKMVTAKKRLQTVKADLKSDPKSESLIAAKKKLERDVAMFGNIQLARKINLNSAYGALGSPYFRFYDVRHAEAITLSGQLSNRWISNALNGFLNQTLSTKDVDYIIAGDTDSCYIAMSTLVDKVFAGKNPTPDQVISFLDSAVKSKIEPFIDDKYQELADYLCATQQQMKMSREVIARRGIWTAKKRYMLLVDDSEGVRFAVPELKIMGFETAKSSTPEIIREYLKKAVRIILSGTEETLHDFIDECREDFKKHSAEDVAFPRSVSNMAKYSDPQTVYRKGTPIHVRGSLMFNMLLKKHQLNERYQYIQEGEKIKFLYLKEPNPIRENIIAFISVLPEEFGLDDFVDYDLQFEKTFLSPLESIMEVTGWHTEEQFVLDV